MKEDYRPNMSSQLKILYVDIHLHSLNPTNTLMPNMMNGVGDVTFYGPGYLSEDVLAGGVLRFIDKTGPYDILFLGPNMPIISQSNDDLQESADYFGRWAALTPPREAIYRFFVAFLKSLSSIPIAQRFVSMVTLDSYSSSQCQMDQLDHFDMKLLASNEHFVRRVADLPAWANREKHYLANKHIISDAWYDYLAARPERVITSLHFVSDGEFSFRGLAHRKCDVSIPGVDYHTRREAVHSLKRRGIGVSSKFTYNVYRVLNKLGMPVYSRYPLLKYFNVSYFFNLMNSRYVFTAAEAFGMPIRKYFEIPAAGAVLLATACNGFDRIGFANGVNCLEVEPDNLADAVGHLEKNPDDAQRLASAGRNLIYREHSISARIEQVRSCMNAIIAGKFLGAEWVDGRYSLKLQSKVGSRNEIGAVVR
jgi:hypothetical protein